MSDSTTHCHFGDIQIGEQFFDPFCGEIFLKVSATEAKMLTDSAAGWVGEVPDCGTFTDLELVERLNADETLAVDEGLLAQVAAHAAAVAPTGHPEA